MCIDNGGYETSAERGKIYVVLRDKHAHTHGDVRVVDESGEDYLFRADRFVMLNLPPAAKASVIKGLQRQ